MAKITLQKFDPHFLTTIRDYQKIHLDPSDGTYYTIFQDQQPVGIIGFKTKLTSLFLKIGIHQDYRGQGIFTAALKLLVRKHHLKKLYSTISQSNLASIKAHQKLGFTRIPLKEENHLKQSGLLLKRNIRMIKEFNYK